MEGRVNIKIRSPINFYMHAWPFIHCLYFIYAQKKYKTVEIHL